MFIEDEWRCRLFEILMWGNFWSWYNVWFVFVVYNVRWCNLCEKIIRSWDDRMSEVLFVEEIYSFILNCVFILNFVGYWLIYVFIFYYDMYLVSI